MRKTLFSYTRKRVFDILCNEYIRFSVSHDCADFPSIDFEYAGTCHMSITERGDKTLKLNFWLSFVKNDNNVVIAITRKDVDAFLYKHFGNAVYPQISREVQP